MQDEMAATPAQRARSFEAVGLMYDWIMSILGHSEAKTSEVYPRPVEC
jgi:hypothetical protein